MKKLLLFMPIVAALFGCGCNTIKTELDPVKVSHAIEIGAQIGAKAAIAKDHNARAYFEASEVAISALINSGQYDSASLTHAMNNVSAGEVRNSEEVKNSIQSVLALYAVFEGDVVSKAVNKNDYLSQGLKGLDAGIKAALAATAPTPSP